MDFDNPAISSLDTDSLSLPLAVLGDLPARVRFHLSQDAAARAMQTLVGRITAASPGRSASVPSVVTR